VDGDLAEALSELKAILAERGIRARFDRASESLVQKIRDSLPIPERYAAFLREADPVDVETATPSERVRLICAADLLQEQIGYSLADGETPAREGWKRGWVVIGHSTLLGDPYFLDTTRPDVEGDCPVMAVMDGTDSLRPVLAASSFACFLRILAAAMDVASGFSDDAFDEQDDALFREAITPKIREVDAAAVRGGHWT
jgi:hypothetical protein